MSGVSKNQRAGSRGAQAIPTPHICPACGEGITQKDLLMVLVIDGKSRRMRGYHKVHYQWGTK